ncbi:Disease resistance protein RUN1 [Linum perenne]
MASSSYEVGASSSSSVPGYTGEWEFDVFVCFRGKDTRGVFTSHLAGHLREQGIRVFTDDKLERTEDIGELLSILARSAISVVIFSENFAESTWCLDEVATIAERMEHFGHRVLPVFYRVNPDDVSDDSGTYASTIDNIHKPNLEQKKRWMDALKAVTKRAGRTSNEIKDDYELHKTIVGDILEKLTCMSSSGKFHNLVGMDTRLLKVQRLLALNDDSSNDTHVIGFWGMGGLGKTTLATSLYRMLTSPTNRIKHHFFVNVKASEVEEQVQELYSTLLSQNNLNLVDLGVDHRRERLSRLKVVIVLDNVETTQQVEKLLLGEILDPTKLFGHGSVIIITSRNRGVLNYAKAKTYNVEAFDFSESLELFSLHAFRQRYPSDNLMDLSLLALSYCKGNPLAIKVLGGALFDKDKEYWKSFFHGLEKNPKPEIHDILSSSYHSLKGEEQSLFMDVVCFPVDIARTILITYLATSYESAYSIVEDLISNLYNKRYELIVVHDLLKEMAWNIVKAEPNPSRLKNPDDVCKLFAMKNAFEGGKVIQSLDLDLSKVKKELWLGAKAFEGMDCLRLLSIQREENLVLDKLRLVDGRLDTLPNELRVLYWAGFPSKCLPETFDPEKLVMLDLSHSQIEMCWEGVQPKLVHLITLDLSCCLNLRVVPNLSACKKLEVLLLKGCKRLVEMPPHIQYMDKLVALDLSDCSNLIRLPAKLNSKCLEYVLLSNCPKVTLCPEINFSEASLQILDLRETPVRELPSAVHIVKQGGILLLCGKYITSFPRISKGLVFLRLCHTMITKMDVQDDDRSSELLPKFDELALVENSELVSLSSNIWDMVKYILLVEGSPLIESLPDISNPVNDLTEVCIINCRNLKSFPSGINHLKSVETIRFVGTAMKSLPSSIHLLDNLRYLNLAISDSLESIPDNLHQLAKLELLSLSDCTKIQSLPQLLPPNLKFLYLGGCKSLQALPSNIGELNLQILEFDFCPQLDYELADKIAADFHSCALMCPRAESSVLYSGSELPQWCSSNGSGANCEMELPPPSTSANNELAKGIAFGVVFSSCGLVLICLKMQCDVIIEGTTVATFLSRKLVIHRGSRFYSSDYVLLWFDKNLLGETQKEEAVETPWYVKYAGCNLSFRVHAAPYSEVDVERVKKIKFKRFGVSLLY